ncbi:MAG: TIGR01777 family protein [Flavobacteriales bacterium CG_4_9_14_0_2_um_filter_35_242]|nr:TIGR01777 family protein [Zetaproteobacteria bacterium]PIV16783.1 MAG: TIGR01777 family protein [Flavobacteriales bacterium CG03_land_8_20_14_0_80_35_15]PIX06823.1 MAG: TIGR01777 family protein [Flavobacteriales bacterium CG_4_8_14_3_um_filter_35_10]PJA04559.1 MAG: TIGR01777 family protein [Flavobacteriales bacterium CG_4_10_14_0_2_um_filter_35_18]PJC58134.1 MAG: TIGR01777 family protein [Flavobacteriales bacterium CG_4_9_14_0_2_um_filter_35_242]
MKKILITGGTGLVGTALCFKLQALGFEVAILSRTKNEKSTLPTYYWDVAKNKIDISIINSVDCIIHLAGVNISEKRWSKNQKEQILDSRIKSAELIFNNIDIKNNQLKAFITASAVGFYGAITSNQIFDETAPAADDFLGQTCFKWEQVADKFAAIGIRTVKIRTGIVLTKKGGALAKIAKPIKLGFGAAIGNGSQYLPWIHIDDLTNIYYKAIETETMIGAYNAVAPEQLTNQEFSKKVALSLKKSIWLPNIPAIIFKLIFGEMAVILLNGSRISSVKIEALGFQFKYPKLDLALKDLKL